MAVSVAGSLHLTEQHVLDLERLLPSLRYYETVGAYLGVDRMTWAKWLRRGAVERKRLRMEPYSEVRPGEELYVRLHMTMQMSKAKAQQQTLDIIMRASAHNWTAAAWLLERTQPELFGRNNHEMTELKTRLNMLEKLLSQQGQGAANARLDPNAEAPRPPHEAPGEAAGRPDPVRE